MRTRTAAQVTRPENARIRTGCAPAPGGWQGLAQWLLLLAGMQSKVIAVWCCALAATIVAGCGTSSNDEGETECASVFVASVVSPASATCENIDVACFAPTPQQAPCSSSCSSLSEADCLADGACHAAYAAPTAGGDQQFFACWQVARIGLPGPVQDSACASLDADGCASQQICLSRYVGSDTKTFDACLPVSAIGVAGGN
jgi:hypothetical protein